MHFYIKGQLKKKFSPIGTVVYTGENVKVKPSKITGFRASSENELLLENIKLPSPSNYKDFELIHFLGLSDISSVLEFGKGLQIPDMILEDIVNQKQRPKFIQYKEGYFFLTLKNISINKMKISKQQISIVQCNDTIILFEDKESKLISNFLTYFKKKEDKRTYVLQIIDNVVDNYLHYMELLGERVEIIEIKSLQKQDKKTLSTIHELKKEMLLNKRIIAPLLEAFQSFKTLLNNDETQPLMRYYLDILGHLQSVRDISVAYGDSLKSIFDNYVTMTSLKMNEIMKVLTIISTIFIPITFLAGVYGMNFGFMPELKIKSGYFVLWGIFFLIPIIILSIFKRKKWF